MQCSHSETRNLAIVNISRVSSAHTVTTINFYGVFTREEAYRTAAAGSIHGDSFLRGIF